MRKIFLYYILHYYIILYIKKCKKSFIFKIFKFFILLSRIFFIIMILFDRNIDSALLRRLEKRIYVSLPNENTRLGIFKLYLSDNLLKNKNVVDFLMSYTKQYSGADIKLLCKQAWMLEVTPMWKNLEKKEIFITDLKYELRNIEILKELLKETVPTVTNTDIYDNWDTNINNK